MPSSLELLGIAFCISLAPILIWLWALEHEDSHPEPFRLTLWTFLAGMAVVFIAIPLEKCALDYFGNAATGIPVVSTVVVWAFIEEAAKLGAAAFVALWRKENDEPIDSMMYMLVAALGFSSLENALFLLHPLMTGSIGTVLAMANFRFLGATMIHTIASSTIGACLALSFYSSRKAKWGYLIFGVILATVLHASFNLSILYLDDARTALPFYAVWILFIGVLLAFEKVKRVTKYS